MSEDWRKTYFNKYSCKGVVLDNGFGDLVVKGSVDSENANPTIIFWAANPPTYNTSYSGSGLPFHDPIQAHDRTPNKGAVVLKIEILNLH